MVVEWEGGGGGGGTLTVLKHEGECSKCILCQCLPISEVALLSFNVTGLYTFLILITVHHNMKMSTEQWWNDTDRGKLKYWEKIIIQRGW